MEGKKITGVSVNDPKLTAPVNPAAFGKTLRGQVIATVSRRGKYLRFELEGGRTLVIHLRMTGRLSFLGPGKRGAPRSHLRLSLRFNGGSHLLLEDQRRFAQALVLTASQSADFWDRLGPEPLERSFNASVLAGILDARKRPVKSLLLDQRLIAGIGNIYADEALFGARIHPLRPAGSVSTGEAARLASSIKETLRRAIELKGSSIDTYRDAGGHKGSFQNAFRVHRRAGEPCPQCGGTVQKIKVGGRGTYFCPACQKI